jgi:hypothetical protein
MAHPWLVVAACCLVILGLSMAQALYIDHLEHHGYECHQVIGVKGLYYDCEKKATH